MAIQEIKKICFVGAGTMGGFNSLLAGMAGYECRVYDSSPEALSRFPERQKELGAGLIERGLLTPAQVEQGLSRITPVADPGQASAGADLLSESVFEQLDLKRRVHQEFEALCSPQTILTTNTSGLPLSGIESAVRRGDRFAALHSHFYSLLFDIVAGPRTDPDTVRALNRYVRSLGGIPLFLKKERPGYLYNTMFGSVLRTVFLLVIQGTAAIEDVDRAWMANHNSLSGPFGMMDHVGLNVVFDSISERLKDPNENEISRKILNFVRPFVERGDLGAKTGRGFYTYPDAAYLRPDFPRGRGGAVSLYDDLFAPLAANAVLLAADDYAGIADIDRAWMAAQHSPLGPFGMLDRRGIDDSAALLEEGVRLNLPDPEAKEKIRNFLRPYLERGDLGVKTGRGFYAYPQPAFGNPDFLTGVD